MKTALLLIFASILYSSLALGQTDIPAPTLAGTWNVNSTQTGDTTCKSSSPGDVVAYIWIVSQSTNGKVSITAQGETSFPKLNGSWIPEKKILLVTGQHISFSTSSSSWFKLSINAKGDLVGIRRFVASNGGANGEPCFADSEIIAKRQ